MNILDKYIKKYHDTYEFKRRHFYNIYCLYPIYNCCANYLSYSAKFDRTPYIFNIYLIWKMLLEGDIIDNFYREKISNLFIYNDIKQKINSIILDESKYRNKLVRLRNILHRPYDTKICGHKQFLSEYIHEHPSYLIDDYRSQWDTYSILYSKNKKYSMNDEISRHILTNKDYFEHAGDASNTSYIIFGCNHLHCCVNLDFCLKDSEDFPLFLDLILCNIYNYSINIDIFFDMLNDLPNLKEIINKIEESDESLQKFLLDIAMIREDFNEIFLIKHSKTLHIILSMYMKMY